MRKSFSIATVVAALALAFSVPAMAASSPVAPKYKLSVSPSAVHVKRNTSVLIKYSAAQLNGPNGAFCTLSVTGEGLMNFVISSTFLAPGGPDLAGSISTPAVSNGNLRFSLNCSGKTVATATVLILLR